jgi:hypothetical protein
LKIILFVFSPVLIKKVNIKEGNPCSEKRKVRKGRNISMRQLIKLGLI